MEGRYFDKKAQFVPGEIIVKMKPTMSLNAANLSALGIQAEDKLTSGGEIIYHIQSSIMGALSTTEAQDRTLETVEKIKKQPGVEYSQPNYILHIMKTPNDTLYSKQWHYFNYGSGTGESLGGIDLPKAWDTNTGSQNVVVAVIDTGILPNHEDITGSSNLIPGYDMISSAKTANDGDGRDSDATDTGDAMKKGECFFGLYPPEDTLSSWHGTHVAGTIGVGNSNNSLGIAGINWKVKVQPIRVLGKCGGTTSDINDGIRWAAGLSVPGVPTNPTPAKVINMSLGGEQPCSNSPATQQAINDAVNAGTVVVVAAGNGGSDGVGDDAAGSNPASCDNVITVAASDPQGKLTPYSNWGDVVEIMAPGGWTERGCPNPEAGILSTVQTAADRGNCGVPNAYAFYNGTSMATPHVAGVAALWLAQDATLTPSTLLSEIQAAARPRNSTECPKPCGAGLLSALRKIGKEFSLGFDPDKANYQVGETTVARATLKSGGNPQVGKTVTFSSDNTSVASISSSTAVTDSQGQAKTIVSAGSHGQAVISAKADGQKVQKTITVQTGTVTLGLILDPDKAAYATGETVKARASVTLNGIPQTGKTVTFSSSQTSVANVFPSSAVTNTNGEAETVVTVSGNMGQANITAEADGKKVQKTVTVQKVPDFSWIGFILLLTSIISVGFFRKRTVSL
ncbi:MAG: S8 family serine peptidase [Gammaproteobacteria bacterium]